MIIDAYALDALISQAMASSRLRMNRDLCNSPSDGSQRMLNAIEPGTVLPIHHRRTTSETVVCLRRYFEEYLYDKEGRWTETIDMTPGETLINIPVGHWQSQRSLKSGTVLLEYKNGPWAPRGEENILV